MVICSLPLSVIAAETAPAQETNTKPIVTVSSLYYYEELSPAQFRALPDNQGNFHLDIALDKAPTDGGEVVVYYRTVDDSAVAAWGDYESVGTVEEAYVTLNRSNGYKARVTVRSTVIEHGFVSADMSLNRNDNKLVTRRFLFDLTRVEGDAELYKPTSAGDRDQSELYCYLRANKYSYQNNTAYINTSFWQTGMKRAYWAQMDAKLDYLWENDPAFGPMHAEQFRDQVQADWEKGTSNVTFETVYYSMDSASYINTPHIKYGGTHSDSLNLKLPEDFSSYVGAGICDLGISMNGTITRDFWDSDGDATFHLYYTYQGERRIALSLYLQGEFDDSTFFGWEHAFEYALEGLEENNRDDHMDENFIGFTLYDNDGKVAYEVKSGSREDGLYDKEDLCAYLAQAKNDNYAVELMAEYNEATKFNDSFTSYYLKLPSNFAHADSYSYELVLEKADEDEIRWLENVKLTFALMGNTKPMVETDSNGNLMVSTNLETMKGGDPIRMSVRFDRSVYVNNPGNTFYITADVYSDKGMCLAEDVKFKLKQVEGALGYRYYCYYAWDTLVFEAQLPEGIEEVRIGSLRDIRIPNDGGGTILSFFTKQPVVNERLGNIYVEKDLRTPVAYVNHKSTDGWKSSQSLDINIAVKGNSNARFTDYVTVYYQWSNSPELPREYSSKVIFYTKKDGEAIKSIVGSGDGETYLHIKAVSGYGKTAISDAVTGYYDPEDENATYTPFGPYRFDNSAPALSKEDIDVSEGLRERTISLSLPTDDGRSGIRDIELYYVNKSGEGVLLEQFTVENFTGESKSLTYTISHEDVGVGVEIDEDNNKTYFFEREEVELYWILTDMLGNSSGKTAELILVFDTHDYLESEIERVGAYDISSASADAQFIANTQKIGETSYIYDYSPNKGKNILTCLGTDKKIYYGFGFTLKENNAFGTTDTGEYSATVTYKGTELVLGRDFTVEKKENGDRIVWFHRAMDSGLYEIQLERTEGEGVRVSRTYSVYATDGETDETATKKKIESGTLLTNTVYMLSSDYPYFYYKDADGAICKVYYNGTKQPAAFSSLAKAKEYVYYKELGDIQLVQLNSSLAGALISGTTGYLVARGETIIPQEGQYWIRYKSEAWTPMADGSAWVYYYYGTSGELSEGSLSTNLLGAINTVANRIVGYGKSVVLTDTSLFLSGAMGEKMLDAHGMPYLLPGQIHSTDEFSTQTVCGNVWSTRVSFAADRNIYKSSVSVGVVGSEEYREYPLIGRFELPENAIFQYMTYAQYTEYERTGVANWTAMTFKAGESFLDVLGSSGVHYIREISSDGVSVYAIFIDREAPNVAFTHTDEKGNHVEIPIDGVEILEIRANDLFIGSIAATEHDRLSYVAIYKVSNLSLVGVYTASDLQGSRMKLEDGKYYIVVSDRSGNYYTVTANVSSTELECSIKESPDRFIKLTCNRRSDQILRYEVYLNGELVTATYAAEQTFDKAGMYVIYIQDIYGNEFSEEHFFERDYPTVTWKYLGDDGKYVPYDPNSTTTGGFVLTWLSDNQYKISTAVKMRFSFNENYGFEFVGAQPEYTTTLGTETTVTIEAGQSFALKIYYKNHKDCYSIYTGVVDVTPPSINVSAEVDVLSNGEYALFENWLRDGISMDEVYYVRTEVAKRSVTRGETVRSDTIKINASDPNSLSLLEVYLDGECIKRQDISTGFSQVIVGRSGQYRIVAKDALGNLAEFTFTNGIPDGFDYFVDGAEKEFDLHGYLNFQVVNGKHVYTKVDYGRSEFALDVKRDADVFMSVGATSGGTEIYGFRVSNGQLYSLQYVKTVDDNGEESIQLSTVALLVDMNSLDFKLNKEYPIGKEGAYAVYASFSADKVAHIRVYAPDDLTSVVSVSARVEVIGSSTLFVASELSNRSSDVYFKELGVQTKDDIRANDGFTVDEAMLESERVASVSLYYSKLNDLDKDKLEGRVNIYEANKQFSDEGFYLMILRNRYGIERVYRIAVSRTFGVTSSVTFGDGYRIYYSKNYQNKLYSDGSITLDVLDEGVTVVATRNGAAYTGFTVKKENAFTYLTFSEEGAYEIALTDSYGNVVVRSLEISKSTYNVSEDLLFGYNEKALKRNEGYTNQALSVSRAVLERDGIHYLAIQYGDKLTVLLDTFSETPVAIDEQSLVNAVGVDGDGVYTVICRNRYGAVVPKTIHYRGTPTLTLERTTRSQSEPEAYDLNYALSLGFWSNNSLVFRTAATTYEFTVNGVRGECPKTLVFENAGDYGNYEYNITYIDEYGFEYSFKAYLSRRDISVTIPQSVTGMEIDGVLNTKNDVAITFGEGIYATYTLNNGEAVYYRSGDLLKRDGVYRFSVVDYAGNATTMTIRKDTMVEFALVEAGSGATILNGGVVNSSKIDFDVLNKDSVYIERVLLNGVVQEDFTGSRFTKDGKWELIVCDKLGNRSYFCFYIVTGAKNGFAYTTPYEYRITEMWYDSGDGVLVSYMGYVNQEEFTSSFNFTENGKYAVVMTSVVTGMTSTFNFTVDTTAPEVFLVGCNPGEITINDVSITGYVVGDVIRIYKITDAGEVLVDEIAVTSASTKVPTITEGGKYRIVVESEAGVATELTFVRKHVMNTAGSIFIMIIIGLAVIGLFTGLVYRNKSKTDE